MKSEEVILSILLRFYFNYVLHIAVKEETYLSILLRFYFNPEMLDKLQPLISFQSY